MQVILTRVERRLDELKRYLYPYKSPVLGWSCAETDLPNGGEIVLPNEKCRMFHVRKTIQIPAELSGNQVFLQLISPNQTLVGNAETLIYINGKAYQGLEENRKDVLLTTHANPQESFEIELQTYTSRNGFAKQIEAFLVVRDDNIYHFRHDLRALSGVLKTLPTTHPTAILIAKNLEKTLSEIPPAPFIKEGLESPLDKGDLGDFLEDSDHHHPLPYNVYLVGNSHIDVTWLWTLAETREKMKRTTATALRYMQEYPEYHFLQSQVFLYDCLKEDEPDLFARIQEKAKTGQWEASGGMWVEPDCNITSGESLIRQILWGQRFFKEHFGQISKLLWLPDTFGYAACLPQLLKKAGMEYFVTQKLTWSETNQFPHGHFEWEGLDGTKIRSIFPQIYVARTFPEEIHQFYERYPSKSVCPDFLFLYGYGDGGGGPVREDIEIGKRLKNIPGFPRTTFSRADDALDKLSAKADKWAETFNKPLPIWKGELYLEFHRGTLTTHAEIKRKNRKLEFALRQAEIQSSLAAIYQQKPYPKEKIDKAWKALLLNQFHDILPGTFIPDAFAEIHERYDEAFLGLSELPVDKGGWGDSIQNLWGWKHLDWIEMDVSTIPINGDFEIIAPNRIGFYAELDAMEAKIPPIPSEFSPFTKGSIQEGDSELPLDKGGWGDLETSFYLVKFNEKGDIIYLFDKELQREWLDGASNVMQCFDDRPNGWEAWDINDFSLENPLNIWKEERFEIKIQNKFRTVVDKMWISHNGSKIQQEIIFYEKLRRIDFKTKIDWKEERVLLKVAFPTTVLSDFATYDVQFGALQRPTHQNTSWDAVKFEVAAHKWTDLSDGSGGISLLNDGKYGHDIQQNVMRMTLLRSPLHPDERQPHPPFLFEDTPQIFTDQGLHEANYALFPHQGNWRNGTVKEACFFNQPFVKSGDVLAKWEVSNEAIVIEALKKAEDDDTFILRLYESHGGQQNATVKFPFPVYKIEAVDLLENTIEEAFVFEENTLKLTFGAYEIKSYKLQIKHPRQGWEEAMKQMHANGDDKLVFGEDLWEDDGWD